MPLGKWRLREGVDKTLRQSHQSKPSHKLKLRIQLKLNTALLSTVRVSVCSCVTGVTSHISHIYKGINAMLIIRDPSTPIYSESKIILAIFLAKTRPDKAIFSDLTNLTIDFDFELSRIFMQNPHCLLCLVIIIFPNSLLQWTALWATGASGESVLKVVEVDSRDEGKTFWWSHNATELFAPWSSHKQRFALRRTVRKVRQFILTVIN